MSHNLLLVLSVVGFFGGNALIIWLWHRWNALLDARQYQRAWGYLTWKEGELRKLHDELCDLLLKNEKRAFCLREMEAIKTALSMRHQLGITSLADSPDSHHPRMI